MHPGPEPGWANVPVEHTPSASGLPTSMVFGYSNGGEFRKTYHGLAPPFAQVSCLRLPQHTTFSWPLVIHGVLLYTLTLNTVYWVRSADCRVSRDNSRFSNANR